MKKIILTTIMCLQVFVVQANTLFDILTETYQTSPVLQASQAYLRAVDERVGQARSGWRPQIVANGSISHADQRFKNYPSKGEFDYDNNQYEAGVAIIQPIFSGFRTTSAVDLALSSVLEERENLRQSEQAVLLASAISAVDVVQARALLDLRKSQEQVLERHYKSYQKRFKVGELTQTDVAQAEARLKGAITARITAEGNLETSVATFKNAVGKNPDSQIVVDNLDKWMPSNLNKVLELVKNYNPALKSAKYAMDVADHNISLQRGDLLPSVNVNAGAGYQWKQPIPTIDDNYDGHYWQVGATLSVPLYQGGAEYARVREAKELENRARIHYVQVGRNVEMVATQAWETYQSTKASIESIKSQIKASKMALDGVIREADVGSRTILDVLDAEQEYLLYRVNLISAKRNMTVAQLQLLVAIGQMTAESLKLKVNSYYTPEKHFKQVEHKLVGTGI